MRVAGSRSTNGTEPRLTELSFYPRFSCRDRVETSAMEKVDCGAFRLTVSAAFFEIQKSKNNAPSATDMHMWESIEVFLFTRYFFCLLTLILVRTWAGFPTCMIHCPSCWRRADQWNVVRAADDAILRSTNVRSKCTQAIRYTHKAGMFNHDPTRIWVNKSGDSETSSENRSSSHLHLVWERPT